MYFSLALEDFLLDLAATYEFVVFKPDLLWTPFFSSTASRGVTPAMLRHENFVDSQYSNLFP